MAALRNGIKTVIIPGDNLKDLEEIDQTVRAALRFLPVEQVDTVLANALVNAPAALEAPAPLPIPPEMVSKPGLGLRQ